MQVSDKSDSVDTASKQQFGGASIVNVFKHDTVCKKHITENFMLIKYFRFTCFVSWLVILLVLNLTLVPPVVPITLVVSAQKILNGLEHKGLMRDSCGTWYHTYCQSMGMSTPT